MIEQVVEKLDRDRIEDYEICQKIPNDVISVAPGPNPRIYIPSEYDYFQYDIDNFLRIKAKFIRTTTDTEKGRYIMKLSGPLNLIQYYELIKYIIKEEGFCSILDDTL